MKNILYKLHSLILQCVGTCLCNNYVFYYCKFINNSSFYYDYLD